MGDDVALDRDIAEAEAKLEALRLRRSNKARNRAQCSGDLGVFFFPVFIRVLNTFEALN